jgi:peptidoglycan/xylan/chitin deacetylase (PgdA/CDA1 family)
MNLFTSDIDWAPEAVIADTIELFNKYNVKCTFFCTHQSAVIDSIKQDKNFELAVHPNFIPLMNQQKGTINEVIEKVLEIVPNAKGVRSHSLVQSTPLFQVFKDFGFQYEANTNLPYKNEITPYKLWNGLVKVLHNFEDDVHFMYKYPFNDTKINTFTNPLNVFSMHPIHIYLNTDTEQTYNNARTHYQNAEELLKHRNTKTPGTRDMLINLLENHHSTFKASQTVFEYLKAENFI